MCFKRLLLFFVFCLQLKNNEKNNKKIRKWRYLNKWFKMITPLKMIQWKYVVVFIKYNNEMEGKMKIKYAITTRQST